MKKVRLTTYQVYKLSLRLIVEQGECMCGSFHPDERVINGHSEKCPLVIACKALRLEMPT